MKRSALLVLSIVVLAAVFLWFRSDRSGEQEESIQQAETTSSQHTLTCAFDTWLGYSAFFIADELGYYDDEGVEVDLQVVNPLNERNAAMARGDLDCMGGSVDSAIISTISGTAGKIVFVFEASNGNDTLVSSKEVVRPADLAGRRVAVEQGYVGHLFLLHYLSLNDLGPGDIRIVDMPNDIAASAFVGGSIDAIATWEPFTSQALKRPNSSILATSKGMEPLFAGTLFASAKAIRERPEDLEALVRAVQRANEWWRSNPEKGNAIVGAKWEIPIDKVAEIMTNTTLYLPPDQHLLFGAGGEPATLLGLLDTCQELWFGAGVIEERLDTGSLIDSRFAAPLGQEASSKTSS